MVIRLAVVDSHTLTRSGLAGLVARNADIEIVAECASAAAAAGMITTSRPDVITLDVLLPDGDGLQLAQELRALHPALGIVVLNSHGEQDLLRALDTRVSAFVAKTAPVEEVLAAIRHASVAPGSFTAAGLATAITRRRATQNGVTLSPREADVLLLLRDGLSMPAIAARLFISLSTVKTYVARIYDKLGATTRAQALMTAIHHGLITYRQSGGLSVVDSDDDTGNPSVA